MAKTTYKNLLNKPQWQKRRLQILERDKWTCQCCGDTETELQVHHKMYEKGKMPWEYNDDVLVSICSHCHSFLSYILVYNEEDNYKPTINEKLPVIQKRYVDSQKTYYIEMLIDNNVFVTGHIIYDKDGEYYINVIGFYAETAVLAILDYLKKNFNG